jgi:hypothetical protein
MSNLQSPRGEVFRLLGKFVGVCFIIVGGVMSIWSLILLFGSGHPNSDGAMIIGAAGLTVGILGCLLIKAKPSGTKC